MAESPKTGIPVVDTALATAIATAVERARTERQADEAAAAATDAGKHRGKSKNSRGIGPVTEIAIIAAVAVTYDTLGSAFPKSQAAMARAMASKALELELSDADAPLNPRSRPVRDVAEAFVRGVNLMRTREEQQERREKPHQAAPNRPHRSFKPV